MLLPFQVTLPGLGTVNCVSWDDLPPARIEESRALWISEVIRLRGRDSICDPGEARTEEHGVMVGEGLHRVLTPLEFILLHAFRTRRNESVIGWYSRFLPEHLGVYSGAALWATIFLYGLRLARDPGTQATPRLVAHLAPMSAATGSAAWSNRVAAWIADVLDRPLLTRGGRTIRIVEFRFPIALDGEESWTWSGLAGFITRLQTAGLEVLQVGGLLAAVRRPRPDPWESPDVVGEPQPLEPDVSGGEAPGP